VVRGQFDLHRHVLLPAHLLVVGHPARCTLDRMQRCVHPTPGARI